jgi:hypothetical protein
MLADTRKNCATADCGHFWFRTIADCGLLDFMLKRGLNKRKNVVI